jgi:hypothetical protein
MPSSKEVKMSITSPFSSNALSKDERENPFAKFSREIDERHEAAGFVEDPLSMEEIVAICKETRAEMACDTVPHHYQWADDLADKMLERQRNAAHR